MEFTELNLHPDLAKGIAEAGYVTCTPVQAQVLSCAFGGQDLYVQSQTGTGKTAAFLIVIFQRLLSEALLVGKKAIIMAPTRELAVQIEEEARTLAKFLPFKIGSFYGGVGYGQQQQLLRDNVQILVGTPGRVLDLNDSGQMNLMDIAFLVIDEADRMFDMGFYPDLRKLIRVVPPADRRQTMLFSATLNAYVKNLAWEYTKTPFEIEIAPEIVTLDEVEEILYHVPSEDKMKLLLGILKRENPESVLIFCNTKRYTEIVAKRLGLNGYDCDFIIGDLPQVKRLKVIEDLKAGKIKYLAATDVAARGLDIEGLPLVVNYDLPNEAENYVHRIGRTARAGKTGKAISLASDQDVYELPAIERFIGKKIPSETVTDDLYAEDKSAGARIETGFYDDRPPRRGGRDGDRRGSFRGGRGGGGRQGSDRWGGRSSDRYSDRSRQGAERRYGQDERRYGQDERREGPFRQGQRPAPRSGGAYRPEMGRQQGPRPEPRPPLKRPENLSALSLEERMAYYREKYGENAPPGGASGGGRGQAAGQSRSQGAPQQGAEQGQGRSRRRKHRGGRGRQGNAWQDKAAPARQGPRQAQKGAQKGPAKREEPPQKKGFFARLLGAFKKKK